MSHDVLNPRLFQIDGRVYCDYNHHREEEPSHNNHHHQDGFYREEDEWNDYTDEVCDVDDEGFEITELPDGKGFTTNLQIPSPLHASLIGMKHSLRKQMESETGARIQYPNRNSGSSRVTVTSETKRSLISCSNRLMIKSGDVRWRLPFTHFLSIRLSFDHVIDKFERFRDDIMSDRKTAGRLPENLFQNPAKLHLTLCTLHLLDDDEIERACGLLRDFPADEILQGERLDVDIRGLEVMNDDPSDVDVLYAKVECKNNKLQEIADQLSQMFNQANLSRNEHGDGRGVKLHATLLNSKFRSRAEQAEIPTSSSNNRKYTKNNRREAFDASALFSSTRYSNYYFGSVTIDEILISTLGSYTDGYYTTAGKLQL